MANSLFAPFTKLAKQINLRGVRGTIIQLYTIGDLKFGELKGTDTFGNNYYEDLDQPFGQHRWVEYADIHNPDATMIQPEWHGWMHHVYDETPDEEDALKKEIFDVTPSALSSNAGYKNHIGLTNYHATAQVDQSQYRQRGYKVGSLMTGPNDPDLYYKQPGHPLSPLSETARYKTRKEVTTLSDMLKKEEEEEKELAAKKK